MKREFKSITMVGVLFTSLGLTGCKGELPQNQQACEMPENEVISLAAGDTPEEDQPPRQCVLPTRQDDANMEISATLRDFPTAKEEKMREALRRLKIVINSVEFKEAVLNHEYNGEKTYVDNQGLSNEEIYEKIMTGVETLSPEIDEELDLDITLYYKNNSTVGYTYPNTNRIWVNDKFFSTFSYGKVAANALHEWTHKAGFEHDFNSTARRPFSVPYGVGTIIQEQVDGM